MSINNLDSFTFIFFLTSSRNKSEQKEEFLNAIRDLINDINEFRKAEITMKSKQIEISSNEFYFGFHTRSVFNMGFTTGSEKIIALNQVLNYVSEKLIQKFKDKKLEVDYYSNAEFIISKEIKDPFKQIVQEQTLGSNTLKEYHFNPKRIEIESKRGENELDIALYKKDRQNVLELTMYKNNNKTLSVDAAKSASEELNKISNQLLKEFIKG
jgi:hypothetical protein